MVKKFCLEVLPSSSFDEEHFSYHIDQIIEDHSGGEMRVCLAKFWCRKQNTAYVLRSTTYDLFATTDTLDEFLNLKKADKVLYKEARKFAMRKKPDSLLVHSPLFTYEDVSIVSVND